MGQKEQLCPMKNVLCTVCPLYLLTMGSGNFLNTHRIVTLIDVEFNEQEDNI